MELIDKTALLEKSYYMGKPATVDHPWADGAEVVDVEDIEAMPIIDAAPVVHGRWILKETCGKNTEKFHCSVCNKIPKSLCIETYCPDCGAKMDLEEYNMTHLFRGEEL